ncbi:MAG TPA: hypothetical protein VHP83_24460 [Aggregatilineaceae bacterium]|nr:hypothetical protein [Aggregatilineaceae bacterium]
MARCGADTQVLGAVAVSVLGTSRADELKPYFEKYGLSHYDPSHYYPVEPLLHMVNDIVAERQGMDSTFDFVSLGIANGMSIPLPPEVDTMEKWLGVWMDRHPMLYKGSDIGYVKVEKLGEHYFRARVRWPWVDDVTYGTIYGMCRRFLTHGEHYTVWYDPDAVRSDRGGQDTVIYVQW